MEKLIHNLLIPNLDDKTFEELVDEARARIPLYAPGWTDHNLSDPGITLIELFAWLVEMQIYSLNLVPEENYLKFLKLLNEKPEPAVPARVNLTFTASEDVLIPKGTQITAREGVAEKQIVFETATDLTVLPLSVKKIISYVNMKYTDNTDANSRTEVFYHAFGEKPRTGNMLYLGFDSVPDQEVMLTVYLYESDLPPRAGNGDELPEIPPNWIVWEYWQDKDTGRWEMLEAKTDGTVSLTQSGKISLVIPADMARRTLPTFSEDGYNLFWARCRLVKADYEIPPRVDTIRLNTISATHGKTVRIPELLGQSSGLPDQFFVSQNRPIIAGSQEVIISETKEPPGNPKSFHSDETPHNTAPEVWEARDDLDASGPEDSHYVLYPSKGMIVFGDGVNGRIPSKGSEIMMTYRYGGGAMGNIPANTAWQPLQVEGTRSGEIIQVLVQNERPASGGTEEETLEAAQTRLRRDLKIPHRAVAADDYEIIVKNTPGLRVARAHAVTSPEENLVTVTVVPYSPLERPVPSQEFIDTVSRHLDRHRLITTRICVVMPEYVRVSVEAVVKIRLPNQPSVMEERIGKALDDFLHPLRGGPDGDGWPFGRSVYESEIYAVIEAVDGVDCVTNLALRASGKYRYQGGNIGIEPLHLVYPGAHNIEIAMPETTRRKWGSEI